MRMQAVNALGAVRQVGEGMPRESSELGRNLRLGVGLVGLFMISWGCVRDREPISVSPAPSGDYACRVQTSGKSGMLVSDEYEVAVGGGSGLGNWKTVLMVNHSAAPTVEWLNDRTVAIHFDDGGGLGLVRSTVYAQRSTGVRELVHVRLRPRVQPPR